MSRPLANLLAIRALVARGAHFYVGHSGGKDSQAMYILLRALVPAAQLHVIHADLGEVEWTGVKDHIRDTIDGELLIAKAIHADGSPKDFFSAVRARRVSLDTPTKKHPNARHDAPAFPSSAARFCTSDLKRDPIWKIIRASGHSLVVNCVGIRGEESPRRAKVIAKRGTLTVNTKNNIDKREAYDWWPIAHYEIEEVWTTIREAGQQPHPAYADGNERLSCVFCIFGSDNDLNHGAAKRPELLAKYAQLEADTRTTMFSNSSLKGRINVTEVTS